jgi:valyl-tRNA synthetase
MSTELPPKYEPQTLEPPSPGAGSQTKAFAATPDDRHNRYVVMMPLPNVTGALHMGHAMDNVMQDLLIRWHRMQGDNTLWQAGTDHAGIATQAVVEKRLKEIEGKTRHDVGREALVARIHDWAGHQPEAHRHASSRRWAARATGTAPASRWTRSARARCGTRSSRCSATA